MSDTYKIWDFKYIFLILVVNFLFFDISASFLPELLVNISFNFIRFSAFFYAGWMLAKVDRMQAKSIIGLAVLLSVFDHILLKGSSFFLDALISEGESISSAAVAFYGVLIAYTINLPLTILFVYAGKLINNKWGQARFN